MFFCKDLSICLLNLQLCQQEHDCCTAEEHLMSANWFIHSFKSVMKVPPMQYITNLRIAAAKGYLDNSNKTINEIAAVGYDNALYFSRVFKKRTGMSPSEYKNRGEK